MAAKQTSTVDRQKVITRLVKQLKKEFGGLPRNREQLPVLETMLFAVCLEDASVEGAQAAFKRLREEFFDWNEIRVSTIKELEPAFEGLPDPARRAMRVRYLLYYVFDHQYSYNFDSIRKKPLELVHKQLRKIKHLTPFARHYMLQHSLGNHVIPIDERMLRVAVYLGLVPRRATVENAPDLLKTLIRKADGLEFAWLLKAVSASSKTDLLLEYGQISDGADLAEAEVRLSDLTSGRLKRRVQAASRKAAAEKAARRKVAKRKAAARKSAATRKQKKDAAEAQSSKQSSTGRRTSKRAVTSSTGTTGSKKAGAGGKSAVKKKGAVKQKAARKKKAA